MRTVILVVFLLISFVVYRREQHPEAYKTIVEDGWIKKWNNDFLQQLPTCELNSYGENVAENNDCSTNKKTIII